MTASVSNSTSIDPPPVRSVAETPSRPSLLMANLTRIGLRAGRRSGRLSVATPTSWQSDGACAVALAGHHADVDRRLIGGVGPEVGHSFERDLRVAGQEVDDHILALGVARDTPRLLLKTFTIRVLTSSRTGPVNVNPSCFSR